MIKEIELLKEVERLLEQVETTATPTLDDPDGFIAYYYQLAEAMEQIKMQLFDYYYQPKGGKIVGSVRLIQEMRQFMRKREQDLLLFDDWGNPVAVLLEKVATFATLKSIISEV